MNTRRFAVALCALSSLALGGCRFVNTSAFEDGGLLLRETKGADGSRTEYRLYPGVASKPTINRTQSTPFQRADVDGIVVADVNASLAKRLGSTPWQGVYVQRVTPKSAAANSGLLNEDVILSIAGQPVTNEQQFFEVLKAAVTNHAPVEFVLRRGTGAAAIEQHLAVEPTMNKGTESRTDSIPLETSAGVQHYTGLQVATVPPDLSGEIWGKAEETTIVSGVVTGSPAYHAGLRRGDRVLIADGKQNPKLVDVKTAVFGRADAPLVDADSTDALALNAGTPREGEFPLAVDGPLGPLTASLPVDESLMKETSFEFPILFNYHSGVNYTRWSCLDFIFQFIGTYKQSYQPSPTRAIREDSKLSLFPFGMFEFATTPTSHEYTLFWIIDWKTRND